MKLLTTLLILCSLSLNANALTFTGSEKHLVCAEKLAIALNLQDADYTVWMLDEMMPRTSYAYVQDTNSATTYALVMNKTLRAGKHKTEVTLAHEMVHIMQKIRGDVFNLTGRYEQQTHEVEAYKLEKKLARVCH
jgi:hypothetical protein